MSEYFHVNVIDTLSATSPDGLALALPDSWFTDPLDTRWRHNDRDVFEQDPRSHKSKCSSLGRPGGAGDEKHLFVVDTRGVPSERLSEWATGGQQPPQIPNDLQTNSISSKALWKDSQRTSNGCWARTTEPKVTGSNPVGRIERRPCKWRGFRVSGGLPVGDDRASGQPRGQQLAEVCPLRWVCGPPSVADGKHT